IRCISTITGLGYVFIKESLLTKLIKFIYKIALGKNQRIVFQNNEDRDLFIKNSLVNKNQTVVIRGSGVDIKYFSPDFCQEVKKDSFIFLMVSRLLWDKGLREFVEAGKDLKKLYDDKVKLWLLGPLDKGNPSAVSEEELKKWVDEGIIKYLGIAEDVRPYLCQADCVVLPSYREGIPRSLLEAMAMEKPIITTDSPGCREVCIDGENGFLVKPRDLESLVEAMKHMVEMEESKRLEIGERGRQRVLEEFSEEKVINIYLRIIKE
ncbi:MAG: glycosyltransferase family 4 protein, partial [Caldimicrobium sp.]